MLTALTVGVTATSGLLKGLSLSLTTSEGSITAADLQRFLISLVKLEPKTVDRFIIGNPGTRINKIGTCWMPYWDTCKKDVQDGVNLLVAHEPTFYTHWDLEEEEGDFYSASEFTRQQYIQQVEYLTI